MKLKVCQFAKLILLLTAAFCAELNSLKILNNCTTEEELSMRGGHIDGNCKGYGVVAAAMTTTVLAINEKQKEKKKSLTTFQKGKLIDVENNFWYIFPLKSTIKNTYRNKNSNNILSVDEENFNLFDLSPKDKKATVKKSAGNNKLYLITKKYVDVESKTSKAIITEPRSSSTFPVRQKRQGNRQQQLEQQQQQKQQEVRYSSGALNEPTISQFQAQIKSVKQQKRHQQQQQETLLHRIAVLMPSSVLNVMPVQQGFRDFVNFFHVDLHNITFDFIPDDDLSGFIKLLSNHKYKTVVKTLNVDITLDYDLNEAMRSETAPALGSLSAAARGFCYMQESLSYEFNKSVLLWPCPRMKEPGNFLPSFEAISFAVQSIATKLNWSQVDIYVGDENWGLPLAIAANLQCPYKLVIDGNLRDWKTKDKLGQVIIVTADMNDNSTIYLLQHLKALQSTKVLLIDYVATSFNAENNFYKNLARLTNTSSLMSNLLLLTVLSDKYRHFLNIAFTDNGMEMVQNFRQLRRLKAAFKENNTQNQSSEFKTINWPMHLDSSISEYLYTNTIAALLSSRMDQLNVSKIFNLRLSECAELNRSITHFVEICEQSERIAVNCANHLVKINPPTENNTITITTPKKQISVELHNLIKNFCQTFPWLNKQIKSGNKSGSGNNSGDQLTQIPNKIRNLQNFIDFFHLYDFLISTTIFKTMKKNITEGSSKNSTTTLPKYDFIVLDITRDLSTSRNIYNNYNNSRSHYQTDSAFKWRPLLILEQHEINLNTYITHSIQPGYDDWLFVSTTQLWHCGAICWTIIAICFGILLIIVAASIAAGIAMRNYLLRNRLTKGPNKIVLSANDFVFPVDSRRVDAGIEAMLCCWLQQLQEFGGPEVEKPDLLKGSMSSLKNLGLVVPGITTNGTASNTNTNAKSVVNGKTNSRVHSLARHNPALLDMRARYNGDLVQLKEISMNGSVELKSKAMDLLVMAHGLRHENINPLIGWLSDPNRTAMVFDYCSRGSLQDVLIMDEIKLDWSFRLSLLTDLVRGMRYLHASALRVHGTLTSRNCVVDARWVLKITDYGVVSFHDAQALPPIEKRAKELLWTAPEVLRTMKSHQHHYQARTLGTQMGDVYSFGIIMQEVVVRGEPYCMLSLSAEEIIAKIKKPPPLIRPSVSKGAAPPEAINIMRQCWAEQPEMRPDFNSVYERFKILNHGRKVNFVDTMFQMLEKYSNNLEELIRERTEQLDLERKKTEQLLNRMLPNSVAEKLKMGLAVDPEEFSDVTIYFSDIVGFTTIAAHCSPVQVVDLLNDLYTIFDATINAYNVYKVETIGDAYMVVSGLPGKIPDHAEQIATMALDLLHQSGRFNVKHLPGVPLQLRIGLHTGPCCAGVVGLTMPRYCLFGDTVNTASRMESTGSSWRIHMSQETRDRLAATGGYTIESRGLIDIKGKGMMHTYWLLGKKGFDKTLPTPPPIGESHGLDESLIRNSIILNKANKSRTSTNPSSSRSSSLAGESVEVKVEITPPTNADIGLCNLANSYSIDSNSTATISPSNTLCPEFPTKTPSASPQCRKLNELSPENLLNPNAFNRLPSSAGGSSSRLYKKLEEIMDISSPYNHYKCLSPSESNLSQFYDGKYLFSSSGGGSGSSGTSVHSSTAKFDSKPGSTRLLRRQFSLDRDDTIKHEHHPTVSLAATHAMSLSSKPTMLEIPLLHDTSRSPKSSLSRNLKQNSTSIAQDLEKIEEIPLSPASSQHHSSLDSNINRSPPSTIEARQSQMTSQLQGLTSAPTSPTITRSLKEHAESSTTDASTASANSNLHASMDQPDQSHSIFLNSEELFST